MWRCSLCRRVRSDRLHVYDFTVLTYFVLDGLCSCPSGPSTLDAKMVHATIRRARRLRRNHRVRPPSKSPLSFLTHSPIHPYLGIYRWGGRLWSSKNVLNGTPFLMQVRILSLSEPIPAALYSKLNATPESESLSEPQMHTDQVRIPLMPLPSPEHGSLGISIRSWLTHSLSISFPLLRGTAQRSSRPPSSQRPTL